MSGHIVLSVLLFRRDNDPDTWIAQALEHNIVAHGSDINQAKVAFERTVSGYFKLARTHDQKPFASLKPAPRVFWDTWFDLAQQNVQAERISASCAYMLPVVNNEPLPTGQQ